VSVRIFDTTLRDGEQSPGVALSPAAKLAIAEQLARLGVDYLEAGFPQASVGDFESVHTIARTVKGPTITALARCHPADIEAAARSLELAAKSRIHVFYCNLRFAHESETPNDPGPSAGTRGGHGR